MSADKNSGGNTVMLKDREPCAKGISREELLNKMRGEPDFILEKHYCHGKGSYCIDNELCVQLVVKADFPTRFGSFTIAGFHDNREGKEHTAIIQGDVGGKEDCPVRVHSQCHTGDVWGSLRCDCRQQLEAAVSYIADQAFGTVIYLKQEGRGIGLLNKLRAYQLQDMGLDTVEANQFLGLPIDARDYKVAAKIIGLLGIKSVALLTNNPEKIDGLRQEGIEVARRLPIVIASNRFNAEYLKTKKNRMGHLF